MLSRYILSIDMPTLYEQRCLECGGLGHDRDACLQSQREKSAESRQTVSSYEGKRGSTDHRDKVFDEKFSICFGKDDMEREIEEEESLKNY